MARHPVSARQRVLTAALTVLQRDGLEGVTMRGVAEAAGVTATALYRHFEDKDQLLRELGREAGALFRDYLEPALARERPADRLLGVLVCARRFALDQPHYYELLFLTRLGPARSYPRDYRRAGGDFALLRELVQDAISDGFLRRDDPVPVALTLASHLHGLLRLWRLQRFGRDRKAFEAFADESFARLLAGLAPAARA